MDTEFVFGDQRWIGKESLGQNSYHFPKTKNKSRNPDTLAIAGWWWTLVGAVGE